MIKLTGRRAFLFLLASLLLGVIFGSFHNSSALADGNPQELIYYEGSGGGGGGGGGSAYCPISSVEVNGKICTANGCKVYSPTYPVLVCNFGSNSECPPLERCS